MKKMNYCFHLLVIHPLDLFEGVMRCLGDGKERLLWEGVQEACLGRHDDRGLGHPEGTQRMERWDTERESKEVNSACSHQRSALLPKPHQAPLCARKLHEKKQPWKGVRFGLHT